MGNNKGNRKSLSQQHVCSRMNFLYQASNLMAHSNNNTLAAYYGKLCRNVGTKALIKISPALKRTLCRRCSLPLLPGINTTLEVEQQQTTPKEVVRPTNTSSKRRHRRLRGKRNKCHNKDANAISSKDAASAVSIDEKTQLNMECGLCGANRRFHVDTRNECWPERAEAIVHVIQLGNQTDSDGNKGESEAIQEQR
ncbi:PREDICTED: ribonuclease P protein subunit p21 [Drosophila arizonae]|uniref:Ribonuclease P protein subunit p21 n=1 Tax=Drosophila arizonae TaxID=7263 RepID=A0ABM1PW41_DROAR|nr:PREDICTED: ribonuclease P protein subunit p21 [Drosophila arizonae]